MTQQEAQQQTVLSWLKDAHALEVGAVPTLEDHLSAAEAYPKLQEKLRQHLGETRHHAELVEACIKRLGGQPAALKETVGSVIGKVAGIANLPAKDTVIKNALGDHAAENFEIASYVSLIAGAKELSDHETVETCEQILQEEKEMASWLEGYIPSLTEQYLARVVDGPDAQAVLGNLKETAKDLGEKGKKAASDVDAKNALLASGVLLAGAGAALLVGQALRGKSGKDEPSSAEPLELPTSPESSMVAESYDGYVTEVAVGSSLLEPEPVLDDPYRDDLYQTGLEAEEDVLVEVYTEAWLLPGPYTGVGPKNGAGAGDATGQEVYSRLTQHGQINASTVEVTVDGSEVLLEGTVDSEETKRAAEEAVKSVAGVTNVQNALQVSQGDTTSQGAQEFEHSTSIDASPDEVYAFMSQVENLPKYLPTTHSAQAQEGERVRVQGEAQGHEYDSDGFFRKDEANHRIEWGADEQYYSGWLEVTEQGAGSTMTVHLSFSGGPPAGEGDAPGESSEAPTREQIQEGLVTALESIKNFVEEGRSGGKEEPSAAT